MTVAMGASGASGVIDAGGFGLWRRQVVAILRIELRKALLSRRAIPVYLLAGLPLFVLATMTLARRSDGLPIAGELANARTVYSFIFSGMILGGVVFLGSALVFANLFRGELLDRSLHYYLLSPVRRPVLAVGKYLAGLIAASALFCATTVSSQVLLYVPYGLERAVADFTSGPAFGHLLRYLLIVVLGAIGYGAVFLLAGLVFRNPVLPVGGLLVWEIFHFILPAVLKKFSVIHYLKGLLPIPLQDGPLAVVVAPPAWWLSVGGLLAFSALALGAGILYLRRLEIHYGDD